MDSPGLHTLGGGAIPRVVILGPLRKSVGFVRTGAPGQMNSRVGGRCSDTDAGTSRLEATIGRVGD